MYRLLVGPLTANPLYNNATLLGDFYGEPHLLTFGPVTAPDPRGVDVLYDIRQDTFLDLLQRLPPGWEPDLVLWWDLAFQPLLPGIAQCPYPLAVVAGDWNLCGLSLRYTLGMFDFVLGDRGLIQRLQALGHHNQAWFRAYSFDPDQHFPMAVEPQWDVVFVGNLNYRIHQQRSQFLQRLATLSQRYRIRMVNGVFGADYRQLLAQGRLIFNHSVRGEMNMRAYEAPACGRALLMEANNLEIGQVLQPYHSYIPYDAENFITQIESLLADPRHLADIAEAGRVQIQPESYTAHMAYLIQQLVPQAIAAFRGIEHREFNQLPVETQQQAEIRQLWGTHQPDAWERVEKLQHQFPNRNQATVLAAFINPAKALAIAEHGCAQEPLNPVTWCHLAYLLQQQGQWAKAHCYWQKALALLPSEDESLLLAPILTWPCGYKSWLPLAVERQGLEPVPLLTRTWQVWALFNQGLCELEQSHPAAAILRLQQVVALASDLHEVWYYLGQAHEREQNIPAARCAYQHALAEGVMLVELWQDLARLELLSGHWRAAQPILTMALTLLSPRAAAELAELWQICQVCGLWEEARHIQWAAALAEIPDPVSCFYHWGLSPYSPFEKWCVPHTVYWQCSTPEQMPLLPHWQRGLTDQARFCILSEPSDKPHWQRVYQWQGQALQQLGWTELPFALPAVAAAEGQLEALNRWNWLLLWESEQAVCWDFLVQWLNQWSADESHTCFLLVQAMSDSDWQRLEALSSNSQAHVVLWEAATLTVAEQCQLLQLVQVVVGSWQGVSPYYLHWALALGQPIWLLEPLPEPEHPEPLLQEWFALWEPWAQNHWSLSLGDWYPTLEQGRKQAQATREAMQDIEPRLVQRRRQTWWQLTVQHAQ